MKRILFVAIAVALCFLYILVDDPFGRSRPGASTPRLEEAPPSPALPDLPPTTEPEEPADPREAELPPGPTEPAFLDGRVMDLAEIVEARSA